MKPLQPVKLPNNERTKQAPKSGFVLYDTMRYKRIYRILVNAGHSAMMAARIVIDAQRGDAWAMQWIRKIYRLRHK